LPTKTRAKSGALETFFFPKKTAVVLRKKEGSRREGPYRKPRAAGWAQKKKRIEWKSSKDKTPSRQLSGKCAFQIDREEEGERRK
jgi:hypothetical protein